LNAARKRGAKPIDHCKQGKARGRFFVKKLRKKLLLPLHGLFARPPGHYRCVIGQ
jgi:hypothetical protein